jgi:Acetyltransferase (GNAT) domain
VQNGSVAADGQTFSNKISREYQVRALDTSEFARWDDFVRLSPQGTLFHTTLWLDASGLPYRLLGCFRGSELHGGFALSLVGHRAAGRPHPSFTPYLGIVYPPPRAKYVTEISHHKEIGSAFAKFIKDEFDFLELTFSPEVVDLQPFIWQGFDVDLHYTYRLSLESLEAVLDNMDAARRRNLFSAEKQGVQVEVGDNFAQILRLREMTFKRQGMAASDGSAAIRFESSLRRAGRCQGFLARSKEGELLGGVWIAWDDKRAYYLLGGFDRSAQSNNAVALAMWRAIQFTALNLKLPEFDFEGSMIPAIERFFRKFGGKITPNYTIRYRRPIGLGRRIARKLVRIVCGRD